MPTRVELRYSRNRVKQAGKVLRRPSSAGPGELRDALEVLDHWRACHLRTRLQHAWGVAIEKVGPRIGSDLKSGDGPVEVLELFRTFGDVLAHAEDLPADDPSGSEFLEVVDAVSPDVLRMVGLQVVNGRIRLVLPD